MRMMMFNNPMWITPLPPRPPRWGKVNMALFSVKIFRRASSLLVENQGSIIPEASLPRNSYFKLNLRHCAEQS